MKHFPVFASLILGLVLAFPGFREPAWWARASNLLFGLGSGFLIVALILTLGNVHMFTSASWGTRTMKQLFRGEKVTGVKAKEEYLHYRKTRPRRETRGLYAAAVLLMTGAALVLWIGQTH